MPRVHLLSCFSLPLEIYALCQTAAVTKSATIYGSRYASSMAKSCLTGLGSVSNSAHIHRQYRLLHLASLHHTRTLASSANGTVTFFDPNHKKQDHSGDPACTDKSRLDIEKNWLKAHLRSLPQQEAREYLDCRESETQSLLDERKARMIRANAQLTLDEDPPAYNNDGLGPIYRDLVIRCTTFDAEGNIQKHSESVAKNALCAQHNLQPRDLRKIDSRIPNVIPTM